MFVGTASQVLNPPDDEQAAALIAEVSAWRPDMGMLIQWLRETGMRLAEALSIRAEDVHPCNTLATLSRRVKRGKAHTIRLGRPAGMLAEMPRHGRLFAGLHEDSAVVSTRYGQWRWQRQGREDRAADAENRSPETLMGFRLHEERHAFAITSVIDDDTCLYRLMEHLGHSLLENYRTLCPVSPGHRRHAEIPPEARPVWLPGVGTARKKPLSNGMIYAPTESNFASGHRKLAEGMRFELTVRLDTVRRFSKPLPSATRPPLRRGRHCTAFAKRF